MELERAKDVSKIPAKYLYDSVFGELELLPITSGPWPFPFVKLLGPSLHSIILC